MAEQSTPAPSRIAALDALRGIAAMCVVVYHYTYRYDQLFPSRPGVRVHFALGEYGVQLFFVVSGFVILMSLEHTKRLKDFAIARAGRLYPAYWTGVLLTFWIVKLGKLPGFEHAGPVLLTNLTMFQQFVKVPHIDGVYWTLTTELVFYAAMAILYWGGWLHHIVPIAATYLLLMLVPPALHQFAGVTVPGPLLTVLLLRWANLFVAGMMFYRIRTDGIRRSYLVMLLGCLAVNPFVWPGVSTAVVALVLLAFTMLVAGYLDWMAVPVLIWLGEISYPLYLIHQNIGYIVLRTLERHHIEPNISIGVTIILMLALAATITIFIERPALKAIRRRFRPRQHAETQSSPYRADTIISDVAAP